MPRGTCRLCTLDSELCHSHILPEFFYESNYDESRRFISVSNHPRHRPLPPMFRPTFVSRLSARCERSLIEQANLPQNRRACSRLASSARSVRCPASCRTCVTTRGADRMHVHSKGCRHAEAHGHGRRSYHAPRRLQRQRPDGANHARPGALISTGHPGGTQLPGPNSESGGPR
jgi:hypothetical protein